MLANKKNLRYFYWFTFEYFKRHSKLIFISFIISIITIIGIVSFWPYLPNIYNSSKVEIHGLVGNYNEENIPKDILIKISSGILFVNNKGQFIPALASSWETKDNGRIYKIHLKKDLYWNDGKSFTTKDINFKFKDVEIKANGDYLLEFTLQKPLAIFPSYLTKPIIKESLTGVAGLYKIERITKNNNAIKELRLSPNKTKLPFIIYRFFENESQMINAYKLGEINQMVIYRKSVVDTFTSWKNSKIIKSVDYSRLLTVFFNLKNSKLKEKEVRQAINISIDRKKLDEFGVEANGPIPPISWAYSGLLKKNIYDEELAKQLANKYFEATETGKLNISTFYEYSDISNLFKEMLAKVGINTNLNLASNINAGQFDILLAYWNVPMDPDQYYFWHSTQKEGNITNYVNLKIDKLLEDGRTTSIVEDRKQIYLDFQKIISDDNPALFLYYPYIYTIKRK